MKIKLTRFSSIITIQLFILIYYLLAYNKFNEGIIYNLESVELYKIYFFIFFIIQCLSFFLITIRTLIFNKSPYGMMFLQIAIVFLIFSLIFLIPPLSLIYLCYTICYFLYIIKTTIVNKETNYKIAKSKVLGIYKSLDDRNKIIYKYSSYINIFLYVIFYFISVFSSIDIDYKHTTSSSTVAPFIGIIAMFTSGLVGVFLFYRNHFPNKLNYSRKILFTVNIVISIIGVLIILILFKDSIISLLNLVRGVYFKYSIL